MGCRRIITWRTALSGVHIVCCCCCVEVSPLVLERGAQLAWIAVMDGRGGGAASPSPNIPPSFMFFLSLRLLICCLVSWLGRNTIGSSTWMAWVFVTICVERDALLGLYACLFGYRRRTLAVLLFETSLSVYMSISCCLGVLMYLFWPSRVANVRLSWPWPRSAQMSVCADAACHSSGGPWRSSARRLLCSTSPPRDQVDSFRQPRSGFRRADDFESSER